MKNLKIYFTSDMHGYLYPTNYIDKDHKNIGLINMINTFKKDGNTLIIDGGDTIQGSPLTYYLSGKNFNVHPIADIMNAAGYDFITLGNHDFNYGLLYLRKYLRTLDAKCLCANVLDKTGELPILPYSIKTLENGLKVGVIGITTDFINHWERPENIANINITDTLEAVKYYFDEVKAASDIVIGVYHGGFEYDLNSHEQLMFTSENVAYKLCQQFDFDILLTGHQHMPLANTVINGTHVVQTPQRATSFVQLELKLDDNGNKTITSSLEKVKLDPKNEIYNKYLSLEAEVQKWLDTPIGFLDEDLYPSSHLDMALNGSSLANFINTVQLDESGADISCTSFSNEIKGFDKNVTVRDVVSTYMFPNTLVMIEINRRQLKTVLERCASYFSNDNGNLSISDRFLKPKIQHYNYDYFANIDYTFDLNKPVGDRVVSIKFKGNELDDNSKLTLVMNNYRATGVGGYDVYKECPRIREILVEMPEVIVDYFIKHKHVKVDKTKYINTIY